MHFLFKINRYFYLLFFSLLFVSCKKSEDSVTILADNLLVLRTEQAEDITGNGALGKGNIKVNGSTSVTALGVCWSTSPNSTISYYSNIYTGSSYSSFSCPITGLSPGTTYYVRSYATVNRLSGYVSSFTAYGNQIQFTTSASEMPTISTKPVSSITGTGASSGGVISSDGGKTITTKGVCWSTSSNPTIALSTKTSNGTGTGSFTSTITGLSAGTTYYVRSYATNSSGTAYGANEIFTTVSIGLPTIATSVVSSVTSTSAASGGNISYNGGGTVTSRGLCWSTSQNPTIALTTKTLDGTGSGSFTSNLTNLSPNTLYYLRAYATNSSGTAYGNQQILTTTTATNGIFNPNLTYGTMSDNDGNIYKTIVIGTQTWMAENLKTSKYRNGNAIPTNLSDATWQSTTSGAYTIYNNDAANNTAYGKLYNWYAVADSRNLCPNGWHVPSDAEWTNLVNYLGGSSAAGGKLKSTSSLWTAPNTGVTNESGFSGLPGGTRSINGYYNIGSNGLWWSSTVYSTTNAWYRYLNYSNGVLIRYNYNKQSGYSVRCLKD